MQNVQAVDKYLLLVKQYWSKAKLPITMPSIVPPTDEPMSDNDHPDSNQGSASGMGKRSKARNESLPNP